MEWKRAECLCRYDLGGLDNNARESGEEWYLQSKYFIRDGTCWTNGYGCCMVIGGSAFLFIPIANSFFRTFHLHVSPCVLVETICNSADLLPVSDNAMVTAMYVICNRRSGSNCRKFLCARSRTQCVMWQLGERKIFEARQVNDVKMGKCVVQRRERICMWHGHCFSSSSSSISSQPPADSNMSRNFWDIYLNAHNVPVACY